MSYRDRNPGYGVCGAKNVYSIKTKIDYWYDEMIGAGKEIFPNDVEIPKQSVYQSSFCKYEKPLDESMKMSSSHVFPTTHELLIKNKEVSKYLLFLQDDI